MNRNQRAPVFDSFYFKDPSSAPPSYVFFFSFIQGLFSFGFFVTVIVRNLVQKRVFEVNFAPLECKKILMLKRFLRVKSNV